MGDHRFEFHATFEMHGVKEKCDLDWCNWSGGRDGIDQRITDWLERAVSKSYAAFDRDAARYVETQNREQTEMNERELLAKLKQKYEP